MSYVCTAILLLLMLALIVSAVLSAYWWVKDNSTMDEGRVTSYFKSAGCSSSLHADGSVSFYFKDDEVAFMDDGVLGVKQRCDWGDGDTRCLFPAQFHLGVDKMFRLHQFLAKE